MIRRLSILILLASAVWAHSAPPQAAFFWATAHAGGGGGESVDVTDGLIHKWCFDGDLTDSIGSADLTAYNEESYSYSTGVFGNCVNLSGVDNYFKVAMTSIGTLTNDATLCGWFKLAIALPTDSTEASIWNLSGNGQANYYVHPNGSIYNSVFTTVHSSFTPSGSIARDSWHLVTVTKGDGSVRFYQNTTRLSSYLDSSAISIGTDLLLGAWSASAVLNGCMDDVRLYNRCLTEEEIATLVANGP